MKRLALGVVGLAIGYLGLLLVLSFALEGCVEERIEQRMADSLGARVDIGDVSLSLVRGAVELDGISIRREQDGLVDIRIDTLEADMAPMGWMAFDRDPRDVRIDGVELAMSGAGALRMRERDVTPMSVDSLILTDVRVTLMPTALLPDLGELELEVARARTGPVAFGTGLSWVFALEELDAVARVPGDVSVAVGYRQEQLSVGGGLLGSEPITVQLVMPEPDPRKLEWAQLADLAKALALALVSQGARDWFDRNVCCTK